MRRSNASEGGEDRVTVDWFEEVVEGPEPVPELLVVDDRDDDDRDVLGRGMRLELVQNLPAVFVGHRDVERDRERPELAGLVKALLTAERADHPIPRIAEVLS